jgi:rhamnulokinase
MTNASHDFDGRLERESGNKYPALVAIDLGADSCRVSLLRWIDGKPEIQLVHRFANGPIKDQNMLRWDIHRICNGVEEGLRACAELVPDGITAIGVDGWAVDYVRLDPAGRLIGNPFCYRDERNIAAQKEVHTRITPERLYALTGIQIVPINTLYQLYADSASGIPQSAHWINLPEFVLHHLGGKRVAEYTNATHTQLLDVYSRGWCQEIFSATDLDLKAASPLVPPGTDVGQVEGELSWLHAFRNTRLIAPACHDTASAIAGISVQGNDWAFISSGTWSLVGCVLDSPCTSAEAASSNFSNEGGIGGKINFLKIVNGMWMLQQCMAAWKTKGSAWTMEKLLEECRTLSAPTFLINVDDPDLLLPGNMPGRINTQLKRANQPTIDAEPAIANLIFYSLAARYAEVLRDLENVTGKNFKRLCIVGGGSKNTYLNQLTQKATGRQIIIGSVESSTIGNFAIQLVTLAGNYRDDTGVAASAVAEWASVLASCPIVAAQLQMLGR